VAVIATDVYLVDDHVQYVMATVTVYGLEYETHCGVHDSALTVETQVGSSTENEDEIQNGDSGTGDGTLTVNS